jgi:hypothetical protein
MQRKHKHPHNKKKKKKKKTWREERIFALLWVQCSCHIRYDMKAMNVQTDWQRHSRNQDRLDENHSMK